MTEADQIDALRRHNATLREWLDRAKADAEKMREERDGAIHAAKANTVALVRAWQDRGTALAERDAARAEVARLTEALDAAGRLVKRKADRAAGKEEA